MLNHPGDVTLALWISQKFLTVVGVNENPENISLQLKAVQSLWHFLKMTN